MDHVLKIALRQTALAAALCAAIPALAAVQAEVVSLQGNGDYRPSGTSPWDPARIHLTVPENGFVRTGDGSRMGLLLSDGTQLRLNQNSMIQIKGDDKKGQTTLNMLKGRSWTQSKREGGSDIIMRTPAAVAAIRGTDWEMAVADDGTSTITVLHGTVEFSNEEGKVKVESGEQATASVGKAPVKRRLENPAERIQWVSARTIEPGIYREVHASGKDEDALLLVATVAAVDKGRPTEVAPALAQRVRENSPNPAIWLLDADMLAYEGEDRKALEVLEQGAERFPDDARFAARQVELDLRLDDSDEARDDMREALTVDGGDLDALLAAGQYHQLMGEADLARGAYTQATRLFPDDARGWQGLGVVDRGRDDYAPARQALDRAIALDADRPNLRGDRGLLEALSDNLGEASQSFAAALAHSPDDYVALAGQGLTQLLAGQTEEAEQTLLKALLIEPRYARAHLWLAVARYQLNKPDLALQELARAEELDPRDPLPHFIASQIHTDRYQAAAGVREARAALKNLPYLRSLNELADSQKGTASLGNSLAFFGMEDWAMSTAQQAYYPYWSGSHLFLADRYPTRFLKSSELYQGFLVDPTVFGSSNRFQTLLRKPGSYLTASATYAASQDQKVGDLSATFNGYANPGRPVAWFLQGSKPRMIPDNYPLDASGSSWTAGLGLKPTSELSLFAYYDFFRANYQDGTPPNPLPPRLLNGSLERWDVGGSWKAGPRSQVWVKTGGQRRDSHITMPAATSLGLAFSDTRFEPSGNDFSFRHTFAIGLDHELSWGFEGADQYTRTTGVLYNYGLTRGNLDPQDDSSRFGWISARLKALPGLLIQADLFRQDYDKSRNLDIWAALPSRAANHAFVSERYSYSEWLPRLGAAWTVGDDVLRAAWQRWRKPASNATLAPVATAGVPLDDRFVLLGGKADQGRLQWEHAWGDRSYTMLYGDYQEVDNIASTLSGVFVPDSDLSQLDQLRRRNVVNLATYDLLDGTPVFAKGRIASFGGAVNHMITETVTGYVRYQHYDGKNTGDFFAGKRIPYLPDHLLSIGATWVSPRFIYVSGKLVYRSERYTDEANRYLLPAGWDMAALAQWESRDKRWAASIYGGNLLRRNTNDIWGLQLEYRL